MIKCKVIALVLMLIMVTGSSTKAQIAENPKDISPLLIGEMLPKTKLVNPKGETIDLYEELKLKPTVLVFYRGGWCPYCNLHLSALAMSEKEIIKLGYQIIAISPEDYTHLTPTIEMDEVQYKVYSDPEATFIQLVGIAFTSSEKTKNYIAKKREGDVTEILPVPTVLIINTEGEILFEYISPNYKKRITPELLLAVLANL